MLAFSPRGGTKSDPTKSLSGVSVFYYNDLGSPRREYFDKIYASGGIQVSVGFHPPAFSPPYTNDRFPQEVVRVRGQVARILEIKKSEGANTDWRFVHWERPVGKGVIQWGVSNHPDLYSRDETLRFIEELQEQSS